MQSSLTTICQQPAQAKSIGFTLVELLAVIAVIGILFAILLPIISTMQHRVNTTTDVSNLRQLQQAWAMASTDQGGRVVFGNIRGVPDSYSHWPGRLTAFLGYDDDDAEYLFDGDYSVYLDSPNLPSETVFRNESLERDEVRKRIGYGINILSIGTYNSRGFFPPYLDDGSRALGSEHITLSSIRGNSILFATGIGEWHLGNFESINQVAGLPLEPENATYIQHPWDNKGAYVRVDGSAFITDSVPAIENWTAGPGY